MTGFQKLLCLSLERQPAVDLLPGTVMAWAEVIRTGRAFDEALDAPRFRKAFVTLASTRRSWPAPADFLDALPPRPELKSLPAKAADPEKAKAIIAELAKAIKKDGK